MNNKVKVRPEQLLYAEILFWGSWGSIALMIITYLLYIFGIMDPYIPIKTIEHLWHLPVDEFLKQTNIQPGWTWITMLGKGDFLNFIGIAILGALTIIGYLTLIPAYLKEGEKVYTAIATVEVLVLLLAASGILGSGGH